jgi:hypothetical protein
VRINSVNLENRLCNVQTNCRDRLHLGYPPNRGHLNSNHILGTLVPVEEPSTASIPALSIRSQVRAQSSLLEHLIGAGKQGRRRYAGGLVAILAEPQLGRPYSDRGDRTKAQTGWRGLVRELSDHEKTNDLEDSH